VADSQTPSRALEPPDVRVPDLVTIFDAWAAESQPQWYTEPADPFPAGVSEQLDASTTH